jgi:undecaprenyl-diphosphatase
LAVPTIEAVVLGAIQGVTEFLPISSDGHLAIAQMFFGHEPDLALTVQLHVGTLIATLIVLWPRVRDAIVGGVPALVRPTHFKETPGGRDAWVVLVASAPTAIIGLLLKKSVEAWSSDAGIVGLCLLGSAVAVFSTRQAPSRDLLVPSTAGALLVGVMQGTAVLPGLSRSAMTIASFLWLGVIPRRAFELSFLLSLPAVAGAVLLEARHAFHGAEDVVPLAIGTGVALVVGIGALLVLRGVLAKGHLSWFAAYLVPLAFATAAWGHARPTPAPSEAKQTEQASEDESDDHPSEEPGSAEPGSNERGAPQHQPEGPVPAGRGSAHPAASTRE